MLTRSLRIGLCLLVLVGVCWALAASSALAQGKVFRAGAAAVDVSPKQFPVVISGGFLPHWANKVQDPLHARSLVLNDGTTSVAICVVDTLFMPREMLDEAKQRAEKLTGIPTDHMLISAVHTHSAPSVVGALGTPVDESYVALLRDGIVKSIETAAKRLAPAKVGWAVIADEEHTNCRRWIKRPDKIGADPFGGKTIRAMMHPGYQNPDYVGPAGPKDPGLAVLAVQSPDGRPIAMLSNYSMHYFGAGAVSADYFGRFSNDFARLIGAEKVQPPFVAIMSQGTAGDLHWMDYSRPARSIGIDAYAQQVAEVAHRAFQTIRYHDAAPLAMAERTLTLRRRVPNQERLAWARKIIEGMKDRKVPANLPEVYALEQVLLDKEPERELKLQALRVGDLGITALPNEVFGITGLKLKAQSPLQPTFNIELANGEEGYIPPPEQHRLGGYTTWPARTASLEVQAEPKIVEVVLQLLEQVSAKPRRKLSEVHGPYAQAVLAAKPLAYWRMGEFGGPQALDATGQNHHAAYEDGVALYLEGPEGDGFCGPDHVNRAPHFAGGRMKAALPGLGSTYTVEAWFWNGMPGDSRGVTGYLFSRGSGGPKPHGDHLAIGGKDAAAGKLVFHTGDDLKQSLAGATEIPMRTWHHVVLVRDGKKVSVYLDGRATPEISGEAAVASDLAATQLFVGSRNDGFASFEGKIDEVAVYRRALPPEEIAKHFAAAGK